MDVSEERTGLPPRSVPPSKKGIEEEEPPGKPRRHPLWRDVPDKQWNDWRWQSQNAIRSVRQLRDLLPFTPEELEAIGTLEAEYKLAIPPYYFSLINTDDPNDPIRLQSVTSPLELNNPSGYELDDPLDEDKDMPVPGLTHRYPDRCLIVTTHVCTMYCLPFLHARQAAATMVRGGWDSVSRNDERMIKVHPGPQRNPRCDRVRRRPVDAARAQAAFLSQESLPRDQARRHRPHRHARAGDLAAKALRPGSSSRSWRRRKKCGSRRTSTTLARSPRKRRKSAAPC